MRVGVKNTLLYAGTMLAAGGLGWLAASLLWGTA